MAEEIRTCQYAIPTVKQLLEWELGRPLPTEPEWIRSPKLAGLEFYFDPRHSGHPIQQVRTPPLPQE